MLYGILYSHMYYGVHVLWCTEHMYMWNILPKDGSTICFFFASFDSAPSELYAAVIYTNTQCTYTYMYMYCKGIRVFSSHTITHNVHNLVNVQLSSCSHNKLWHVAKNYDGQMTTR